MEPGEEAYVQACIKRNMYMNTHVCNISAWHQSGESGLPDHIHFTLHFPNCLPSLSSNLFPVAVPTILIFSSHGSTKESHHSHLQYMGLLHMTV